MMDSAPVVFDISSDEEGWGENSKGVADEGRTGGDFDNLDWISELFEVDAKEADDSDDVVVVGEVLQKPKKQREKPSFKDMDGDDDDCVILDGDPDKARTIENDDTTTTNAGDSDDLVIVGEKGQIACRDYPHSRHLCATYPFASTSHDTHCQQCHCYVCDSLAPCAHWGNGTSSIHHCHATDKDEFWILQRKNFRQGGKVPVPRLPDPSLTIRPNPSFRLPVVNSAQANVPAQIHISRSTAVRACSAATNLGILHSSQGRNQQPIQVMPRSKYQPQLVSQQLHHVSRRDRTPHDPRLGPRFNSFSAFKRTGSPLVGGGFASNRPGYVPTTNSNVTARFRSPPPPMVSSHAYQNSYQQVGSFRSPVPGNLLTPSGVNTRLSVAAGSVASHSQMPTSTNGGTGFVSAAQFMSTGFGSSTPSQSSVSSQPNMVNNLGNPVSSQVPQVLPQPKLRISLYSVPSQSQTSSLPNGGNSNLSSVPSQSQVVSSPPNMGTNFVSPTSSSQSQAALHPDTGSGYVHPASYQPQMDASQQNVGSSFVDQVLSQPQLYDQTTTPAVHFDPQNALDQKFPDGDAGWDPFVGSSQDPFADNNQNVVESYNPPFVSDFELQTPVEATPNPLEFQYDSWVMENQSASGAFDATSAMYSPGQNNFLF